MIFEEIQCGYARQRSLEITQERVKQFAEISGDFNPIHLDETFAAESPFGKPIAHGMLCSSLISAVIGVDLTGPGVIYLSQELNFIRPVFVGDIITARVVVVDKFDEKQDLLLKTEVFNQLEKIVIDGNARVRVPRPKTNKL